MLRALLRDQVQVLNFVVGNPRILTPVMIRWVERFGGGLGSPVGPYFLLALGMSAREMGDLSVISTLCGVLPSPVYGWCQDKFGPFATIIVASAACGLGCGLYGFAPDYAWLVAANVFQGFGGYNLPMMINAHVSRCTPPARRALVLAGFTAQCLALRISGQLLYVPWDAVLVALGLHDRLLRFRVTLSVCTFFCWFGVVQLLRNGHHVRHADDEVATGVGLQDPATSATHDRHEAASEAASRRLARGDAAVRGGPQIARVGACLVCAFLATTYESLLFITWPLFIKAHFGWQETEYGPLIFTSTLVTAASVACYPRLHAAVGGRASVALLASSLAAAAAIGYAPLLQHLPVLSTVLVLIANGLNSALITGVLALSSTLVPLDVQGRLFSAVNVANALGRVFAGLLGTRLFQHSLDQWTTIGGHDGWLTGGGALPVMLLAPAMLATAAATFVALGSAPLEGLQADGRTSSAKRSTEALL